MKPSMIYVCAPYAAPTPEGVRANIDRAREIGARLAAEYPTIPILVPHLLGEGRLYGSAEDDGSDGAVRRLALSQGVAWAAFAGRNCGALYMGPGSESSEGCTRERNAFLQAGGLHSMMLRSNGSAKLPESVDPTPAEPPRATRKATHVHVKSRRGYVETGRASLQISDPTCAVDGAQLVLYENADGQVFARATDDFADRFVRVDPPPMLD